MEKPIIIPDSYTYKQIADFAYIEESMGGFDFMFRLSKSKTSLNSLCHNSTQLQVKYNSFRTYLNNLGISLDKFKNLDLKRYFSLRNAGSMRHSAYLKNIFFRYYNPKLTEDLYAFYELIKVNNLGKPGIRVYFGYKATQVKAIERAAGLGRLSSLPTNEEYNALYDFKESSPKYMLFTRYRDIKNQIAQFDLDVDKSMDLTMKLMLLVIDKKETSYEDFLDLYSISSDEILSERRYKDLVGYYKRYRSLISRYNEIVEDINGGCNWANFLYKYELDVYGLENRQKFLNWMNKVVPIKALIKKEL